nr:2-phosphosulfolactate phosphatase [Deltaproteobacteria bacterium]
MIIKRTTLKNCGEETDTVVAIDVLRAFTTAAFAFAGGALEIILVSSIDEAFTLRERFPESLIIGELDCYPVEGFDFNNSPSALLEADLSGCRLIQRTTAGTQGIVRSSRATNILATSLVCASATVKRIRKLSPLSLTLIETGVFPNGWGDEDVACGDLIEGLLNGQPPHHDQVIQRVRNSVHGKHFLDSSNSVFPSSDLELAIDIDRFEF